MIRTVRCFDFGTKAVTVVPETELTEEHIPATVEGVDGEVWVRMRELKIDEAPVSDLDADDLRDIERIESALGGILPEQDWRTGMRMEASPQREIAIWLRIAKAYERFLAVCPGMPRSQREFVARLYVAFSFQGPDQALRIHARHVPREARRALLAAWTGSSSKSSGAFGLGKAPLWPGTRRREERS